MTTDIRIAIYDLDRTITDWPTYSHFLVRSASRIAPLRLAALPVLPILMLGYRLKLFSRDRLKVMMWAMLLGRAHPDQLQTAIDDFTRFTVSRNIRPGARKQIAQDRRDGVLLVLATAAHELYARPIAQALGFDAVIATRAACGHDGRIGPALTGENCYGEAKLSAIEAFFEARSLERNASSVTFYSDSSSDKPVFAWCDQPVAVNPSRKLAKLATAMNWTLIDWGAATAIAS